MCPPERFRELMVAPMSDEQPKSYLTDDEIQLLQKSKLNRETPFLIRFVSMTQFSIARVW